MRGFFKFLPIGLLAAIVASITYAQFLPTTRTLKRSVTIEASSPAQVYDHIAHIRKWSGWYVPPGAGRFEGPELGAGGTLILIDPQDQEMRRLQLVETSSPSLVKYHFPEAEQLPFDISGWFQLETEQSKTRVTSYQQLTARAANSAWMAATGERWFLYLFADRFVGSILERELHNLKSAVENKTAPSSASSSHPQDESR